MGCPRSGGRRDARRGGLRPQHGKAVRSDKRAMRSPPTSRAGVPFSVSCFRLPESGRNPDGQLVEGLRIARKAAVNSFVHEPVMLDEVVDLLAQSPPGICLDCTVGGGGHARALLEAAPQLALIGVDRDLAAIDAAGRTLAPFAARVRLRHARFDRAVDFIDEAPLSVLTAVLFDLGVSSPQLDTGERGFSYRTDGPLDMRMDSTSALTADSIVNGWAADDLAALFREHGERRFASRIARAIVAGRPLSGTMALADVVKSAIPAPARRTGGHPARRVFQAVRVAVNDELVVLGPALDRLLRRLAPGGRCVTLAYHSGEDRIVKDCFREAATGGCTCPPRLPCVCGAVPRVRYLVRGALRPSKGEVEGNHRAESARLRAVEALGFAPGAGDGLDADERKSES